MRPCRRPAVRPRYWRRREGSASNTNASPIYPRFEVRGLGIDFFVQLAEVAAASIGAAPRVKRGLIVTGDQFIKDEKRLELLRDFPDGLCVEMEGAAVAQICYLNQTPFVIVRIISDRADGAAPADFKRFVDEVAPAYTVGIVSELLARLS